MAALLLHLPRISVLLKGDASRLRARRLGRAGERGGRPRIRCPRCEWEPGREDRWACGCNFVWNTFDTGGVCPACHHHWLDTMCLRCHQWSRHADWYVDSGDEPAEDTGR